MSVIEKFVAFTETLPEDRLREIEDLLESIMGSNPLDNEFTPEEIAELDRRVAEEPDEWIDEETFRARLREVRG